MNIPRRDSCGLVRQQCEDFITLGAAGRMASTGKDAKLFTGKPICQPDCALGRVQVHVTVARVFTVNAGVETNGNAPCLFIPPAREGIHV
ncbi:MAG TPA: hypothetical protein VFY06_12575, partial [Verrucomicrobiae bacterium]|nr:hypothetical protein [Verrucomicrobiae bacterium]